VEIAAVKKKHFIVTLFIAVCFLLSSCSVTRQISEGIKENSFKNKIKAQFKEDFPAYEVRSVVIKTANSREKAAIIFYRKPNVKGTFTAEWKYYDRDENPDNSKEGIRTD
jgi:predicted small secreted protein